MTFALIVVTIICIIAAVITFSLTQIEDKNYNSDSSLANLINVYLIWLPAGLIVIGITGFIWYII
ncbi:BshB3 potential contributor to bacillithiol synthesis [Alteribacillus sp. YIM 98480]|uniref:BshB3 potential contributor to bacillithiol synthesis n=1 Tax=Alteribacillus sp. YIM 98480 TaxID=2606599 RepID=UPI00131E3690|nr:BshB3 potential contributor to bacillithiol synthesis [Alteribacillus sp. YIM 98480]